ncbi:MAG: hypothetical protein ACI9GE_000120 [Oceanospirillaceae bacterium]|jgi:PBP1b-binding outer membrane lipoprotein LpoB
MRTLSALVLFLIITGCSPAQTVDVTGKPNVTVVEPKSAAIHQLLDISKWPDGETHVDLGGRKLTSMYGPPCG